MLIPYKILRNRKSSQYIKLKSKLKDSMFIKRGCAFVTQHKCTEGHER